VGGDEDDGGHEIGADFADDAEAVHFGHLDVEENEVGAEEADGLDGFEAIARLVDRGDVGSRTRSMRKPSRASGSSSTSSVFSRMGQRRLGGDGAAREDHGGYRSAARIVFQGQARRGAVELLEARAGVGEADAGRAGRRRVEAGAVIAHADFERASGAAGCLARAVMTRIE
jgi:hypothetical protein